MRFRFGTMFLCLLLLLFAIHWGCDNAMTTGGTNPPPPPPPPPPPEGPISVVFTPVGVSFGSSDLIDMEFLPGQNGEAIVIGLGGTVYYMRSDFTPLAATVNIPVDSGTEQGLLNVVADPLYASNGFIYLYYTVLGMSPDVNQVSRFTVNVNTAAGTFSLMDEQVILQFPKVGAGENHNGGSMVFMTQDQLAVGVGEGGDTPDLAQDWDSPLGKIHRVIPSRTAGVGGFTDPGNGNSAVVTSNYSRGLRNPFTMVVDDEGDLFVGDVGANTFEEINCVYYTGENYFWPICEGPCASDPINPIHGYAHSDTTFYDQDPLPNNEGPKSIILSAIYQGTQYNGVLTDKIIYNEFFGGWVRLLTLGPSENVIADQHIGHLEGLTGLQTNPADGLLYGVSLFGSDQIQRLDLAP